MIASTSTQFQQLLLIVSMFLMMSHQVPNDPVSLVDSQASSYSISNAPNFDKLYRLHYRFNQKEFDLDASFRLLTNGTQSFYVQGLPVKLPGDLSNNQQNLTKNVYPIRMYFIPDVNNRTQAYYGKKVNDPVKKEDKISFLKYPGDVTKARCS